ncbi:hypothetical protein CI109_105509 [Kwoniella shandongensis]|uniref:FAS1 domain-containing protein n=1 Tax=Kwoniella shandongensis TaxID=1734106 RepID=A0AAJ8LKI8_9TREE
MWSSTLLISVLLAARGGLSAQLAFGVDASSSSPQYITSIPVQTQDDDISINAETIVSALSASSEHTIFLHLLQRSKSVPMLAHIGNATVFAPTDQAWTEWADRHHPDPDTEGITRSTHFGAEGGILAGGWLGPEGLNEWLRDEEDVLRVRMAQSGITEEEERRTLDNQNWALRQHLLYHMLNYTLPPASFVYTPNSSANTRNNISIQTTLLYPQDKEPILPPEPEPGPPWLPRGGEGLLGGHGQRVRLIKGGLEGEDRGRVGVDWEGNGGVAVWDGKGWERKGNDTEHADKQKKQVVGAKWVRNGVVVGVEGVLDMPMSIEETIRTHPSLSYLSRLLPFDSPPSPLPSSFATTPHLTVFAPSNEAFDTFDDIEKGYLEGPYGEEGVGRIVAESVIMGVGKGRVGWSDTLSSKTSSLESASGDELEVRVPDQGKLTVNGTEAETIDIYASNGVIHIIPSLLLPENFTLLNSAEKMLLSLNATRFVSLLRTANLSNTYIGEDNRQKEAYTILAPTDDVLEKMDRWAGGYGGVLPELWAAAAAEVNPLAISTIDPYKDASPIAALLQYHILPGRLLPEDIKDGLLLGTELRTSSLSGGRQRLKVEVTERPGRDRSDWETIGEGEVRFGGATVIGKPVKTGKSIIYLISSLLSPPDDVLQTAVSDLQLSTFIAAVYAAELEKALKHTPATTYFMPRNRAFGQLGLTMKYLLLPDGKDDLRKVIKYHAVNEVVYTDDIDVGKKAYKTLEGGEVVIERTKGKNGSIYLRSPTRWEGFDSSDHTLPANGELRPARVSMEDANALTNTGVIHTVDSVIMPADVKITLGKLLRGSKQSTMADLMVRAGLGWILEGREPSDREVQRVQLDGRISTLNDGEKRGQGQQPITGDDGRKADQLAYPSYTLLCPSDKAFSRLNLTHYLQDQEALINLLKLHIIPSVNQSSTSAQPRDGLPLSMDDDLVYSTLLSGGSKYGDVAFRATGDNSFIVGIRGARGNGNREGDSARVGQGGRASVRWKSRSNPRAEMEKRKMKKKPVQHDDEGESADEGRLLWEGGMTLGGGVLMIDSVLIPYQSSWFSRWGWLVLTLSGIGVVLLIAIISVVWWYITREKKEEEDGAGYEPLEGEVDE